MLAIDAEYLEASGYNEGTTSINSRGTADTAPGLGNCVGGTATMSDYTTFFKTCSKCGESKPATTEYFYRSRAGKFGLRGECKVCVQAYIAANRERISEYGRAWHNANRERRLEYARMQRVKNRERIREKEKIYYAANKERVLQKNGAWFQANREHHHALTRAWYAANKELRAESVRKWRARNLEKVRVISRQRRARVLRAEGTHTADDVQAQYVRQRGKCYYCGVKVGDIYHVDHVVPLSRGGTNWPENLVIACPACNSSKQDKLPHEWSQGGRLL